jgi:MFS family permease
MSVQMLAVAVGYEIYEITRSPLWLGLSGLVQFFPRVLFMLPSGQAADRYDRRRLGAFTQFGVSICATILLITSLTHTVTAILMLVIVFSYGTAFAFQGPALVSLLPNLVSKEDFPKATARVSSMQQAAIIVGPAVAGFLYIAGAYVVYSLILVFNVTSIVLVLSLRREHIKRTEFKNAPESPLAGLRYIRKNKGLFGAITLDMFAVLFSGVTALLPIFAEEVLHSGPVGFGFMRAAPAVGALIMAGYLSFRPVLHRTGKVMFAAVGAYGLFTIAFAFSTNIILSVVFLIVLGLVDQVSVVIRSTYTQVVTTDDVRGRVTAVNFVFIGASNQLGEFESGVVASLIGTVPAVIFGGVCTLAIVAIWYKAFPVLSNLDKIE